MFLILAWIFISFRVNLCNAINTTKPTTLISFPEKTNVESVIALKEYLLRNNDDYKDSFAKKSDVVKVTVTTQTDKARHPSRRANDNILTDVTPKQLSVESPTMQSEIQIKNITNRYPKLVNKEKVNKLMKFLDKHKELVKQYISNKNAGSQTDPMPPAPAPPPSLPSPATPPPTPPRAPRRLQGGQVDREPRAKDWNIVPSSEKTLSGKQLDMSPAKGGKVQSLRWKNKLCQRQVLHPEGPKYDSKGKIYLKAYSPIGGHDFPQTRMPRLLLPRCCNCCKKSALGCE